MREGSESGRGSQERSRLRRGRDSVCLYIIYSDIGSVHACLAPQCPPLSTACSPQGCLFVNLDSIQTTVLYVGVEGGGLAYCCKQGKGQPEALPLTHLVPSPSSAPEESDRGHLPCFLFSLRHICLLGDKEGGHQGSGKGTRGQGVLSSAFIAPRFGTNITKATGHLGPVAVLVPDPLQCLS